MRTRRLRKTVAHLEVTAFINVIVVLVPFLLSTAVFTRLSVMDLSLPAQTPGVEQLKVEDLKLEIVMRPDSLDVGDKIGGLIQRIPNTTRAMTPRRCRRCWRWSKASFATRRPQQCWPNPTPRMTS